MKQDRIGPYRILDTVAEDALTVTYRAEDPGLGRTLLLKAARSSAPAAVVRERLTREAKVRAGLAHPSVLTMYGIVRRDDATVLLLEDVRGPRLSEVRARLERLDVAQALAIAALLAEAVAHVHGRGIVHAGLRPERLVLVPGGIRLVDFFTARAAGSAVADGDEEPQTLPEYMAPEQILEESVDLRADVFSIGVILFELLTGRRPFEGPAPKTPVKLDALAPAGAAAAAHHDLAQRIRTAPPAALVTTAGAPSEAVARIVSRCLAKDPADRYEGAAALAEELFDALRELTTDTPATLVTRALAAADFAPAPPPAAERIAAELTPRADVLRRLLTQLAAIFGLVLFGALITEWSRAGSRPAPPPSETPPGARGYLRVLAQPWAEVIVDGETIDTTPIARPIAVAAGRHFVTFVHPNAPEEKRSVNVVAGQTVLLDVVMRVERRAKDAGTDSGTDDDSP